VPQIEGLTVEDFLKHARKKPVLLRYLPDEKDWNHLDKKWVCDVLYTHDTEAVQGMITKPCRTGGRDWSRHRTCSWTCDRSLLLP